MLIFGLPPALTALWFAHQRYQVRQAFKQSRPKTELVYLAFSRAEAKQVLDWKEADEFRYGGQMYDVIQQRNTVDSVQYWCWPDAADSRLYAQLEDLLGHDPVRNTQLKNLFHFLQLLFLVSLFFPCFFQMLPIPSAQFAPYVQGPRYRHLRPSVPPPRVCS
ncbi:MAG: hypothetical protein ACFCUI_11050 [Bernardetiaceae bacterium]